MLYMFDMDDTLISGYMNNPNKEYDIWEVLPGRRAMLNRLFMRGDVIVIITNQAGVAFGYVTHEQATEKLNTVLRRLGIARVRSNGDTQPPQVYCCLYHPDAPPPWNATERAARRKPSGAMLIEAMNDYPDDAARGVLMVGDREEDLQAAKAAGVPFQWAHMFFKDPAPA
jgi:D-glycero-D-manno-heptose 1,7-bisphosphate phosphatase